MPWSTSIRRTHASEHAAAISEALPAAGPAASAPTLAAASNDATRATALGSHSFTVASFDPDTNRPLSTAYHATAVAAAVWPAAAVPVASALAFLM